MYEKRRGELVAVALLSLLLFAVLVLFIISGVAGEIRNDRERN